MADWRPEGYNVHRVRGWLTQAEGDKLARLAEGKKVLEIGSYCGRSTIAMALECQRAARRRSIQF